MAGVVHDAGEWLTVVAVYSHDTHFRVERPKMIAAEGHIAVGQPLATVDTGSGPSAAGADASRREAAGRGNDEIGQSVWQSLPVLAFLLVGILVPGAGAGVGVCGRK